MAKNDDVRFDEGSTIVVTGANGFVGRALLARLKEAPVQVVALTRSPVDLPAKRLVTGPLDSDQAQAAIKSADYVIHLAGVLFPVGKDSYQSSNVEATANMTEALREGKVKRIVYLSYVGASEDSTNLFLRTKAMAERLLLETRKEVVIFRSTHIVGPPGAPGPYAKSLILRQGKKAGVMGNGRQQIAPLYIDDAVAALALALTGGSPGVYDLAGPDQMTLDDLVRLLNKNPDLSISHTPTPLARLLGIVLPMLPRHFVDLILRDSVGDPSRAKSAFGLKLTSLRRVWVW